MDSGSGRGGEWAVAGTAGVTALVLTAVNGVVVEARKDA